MYTNWDWYEYGYCTVEYRTDGTGIKIDTYTVINNLIKLKED